VDYTPSQRKAISTIDPNLQIIACAGSGKTQVISARVVEILKEKKANGIAPRNIVAFTFTDKAAGELKDRIHRLCLEELGSDQGLAEMYVGTIHGYCLNLLQSPPLYEFLKFSVLPEVQQRLLIDRYSSQCGLTQVPLLKGGTLERWKDSRLYMQLISVYSEGQVDYRKVPSAVRTAVEMYYGLLDDQKRLDYTMIIAEAIAQIKGVPELRNQLSTQVKYLVVDEYQDVNPLQETLIRELQQLGANLCVVGDDDQTIYQFRGSDVTNIIQFAKRYPAVKSVRLNENFRSSKGIVETARKTIEANDPDRLAKEMASTDAQDYQRGDLLALGFDDPKREATWIVEKIKSLYGTPYKDSKDLAPRGMTYSDFAVLMRSVRKDAGPLVEALDKADIPYIVGGMTGLFDTEEIQAIQAIFFYMASFTPPQKSPIDSARLRQILAGAGLGLTAKQVSNGLSFLERRKAQIGDRTDAEVFLQRLYLDFLATLEIREEDIDKLGDPSRTGEIVFYNLGKFSQLISDYEQIHFKSSSGELYKGFAAFLYYQAPDYYPEGWLDVAYGRPDAVQVMTVHQAKGMQWPCVFVPCLRRNRFPSKAHGGRSIWNILPQEAVTNAERYRGNVEDERRLFYVALTRAEKYLYCTWSPVPDNQLFQKVSQFFLDFTGSPYVLTKEPRLAAPAKLNPKPRKQEVSIALTFSELKYYFLCPYQFKLRFLYGFNGPIDQALGYGKSLHDALAQIHSESMRGNIPDLDQVDELVEDHLHLPFASPAVTENLRQEAVKSLTRYLKEHRQDLDKLEHVEKVIELKMGEGVVVNGRIDLIRRTDTGEVVIVDFKSRERAQAEDLTASQLHIYAVGYEQLTGTNADLIEVHNLDVGGSKREMIDPELIDSTMTAIRKAGRSLRENHLPRLAKWGEICKHCDVAGLCRTGPAPAAV
jgi:ATP-dependent DNA helicase UvrD/PcrA